MNRVLQTVGVPHLAPMLERIKQLSRYEEAEMVVVPIADALGLLPTATTAIAVATVQSTPPVGTPTPNGHGGNSAPARALVAGVLQSERTGEHRGSK